MGEGNQFLLTIDGQQVPGADTFSVLNPATEEAVADAPAASPEQLEAALQSAEAAYPAWAADEGARRTALQKAAAALTDQADAIARTLTLEQGKPLAQAQGEVRGVAASMARMADAPLPGEVLADSSKGRLEMTYRPFGVTAGITPWNFPILIAASKVSPALLAGNTMVLKPSPYTPLSTLQMGAVLSSALPPGVLNVLSGGNELGATLTTDRRVKKISFTGSIATGKAIAAAAATDLKRLTLELGGNDAAIVLDDADVNAIAPMLFWGAFMNCGQVCIAVKRLFVPEAMQQPMVEALVKLAADAKVGDGMQPDSQIGPINNKMQLDRVLSLLQGARDAGANIHCGGERLARPGYFVAPTVVSGLADDVPLVAEEQFGPILPVLTYTDVDDAVRRANATPYGLGASVWSPNAERAREVGDQLDAGTVWINQHSVLGRAPFTGSRWSGLGVAGGKYALQSFMQLHVINHRYA